MVVFTRLDLEDRMHYIRDRVVVFLCCVGSFACGARSELTSIADEDASTIHDAPHEASKDAMTDVSQDRDASPDQHAGEDGSAVDAAHDVPPACFGEGMLCLAHEECCTGMCLAQTCYTETQPICAPGEGRVVLDEVHLIGELDVDATHIYWASNLGGVWHMPKAGGVPESVVAPDVPLYHLAVDAENVYASSSDGVWFASKTGSVIATFPGGVSHFCPITADLSSVFFSCEDSHTLLVAPKTGSSSSVLHGGLGLPFALGRNRDHVFVGDGSWDLLRVSKATGALDVLSAPDGPTDIEADTEWVYWIDGTTVNRIRKEGGAVETIVTGLESGRTIALDRTHVYFADSGGEGLRDIYRVPKSGGQPSIVLSDVMLPYGIAVDESCLYWNGSLTLGRVAKE